MTRRDLYGRSSRRRYASRRPPASISTAAGLPTLFAMKVLAGRLRHVGITTSEGRRHREIEAIMRSQPIDFVQVTYNVLDREVEERVAAGA